MAEQETTVPIEDKGMLSDIMAEREPEAAPEPEAVEPQETPDRPRDEAGRFVSKAPEPDAAPTQQQAPETPATPQTTDDDKAAQVPSWRLREVREAREAAERRAEEASRQAYAFQHQMQEMQRKLDELNKPKPQPVDIFENPDEAIQQRLSPLDNRINNLASQMVYRASLAENIAEHGRAAIEEMRKALTEAHRGGDPEIANLDRLMSQSDDPVGLAMKWHQQAKLRSEVGTDLTAYKTKLQEELLANPEFLAKAVAKATGQAQSAAAQPGSRPNVQLPPSLNKAIGAGLNNSDPNEEADMTDRSLFRHAMAPRR